MPAPFRGGGRVKSVEDEIKQQTEDQLKRHAEKLAMLRVRMEMIPADQKWRWYIAYEEPQTSVLSHSGGDVVTITMPYIGDVTDDGWRPRAPRPASSSYAGRTGYVGDVLAAGAFGYVLGSSCDSQGGSD